jgi:hypothetical protein
MKWLHFLLSKWSFLRIAIQKVDSFGRFMNLTALSLQCTDFHFSVFIDLLWGFPSASAIIGLSLASSKWFLSSFELFVNLIHLMTSCLWWTIGSGTPFLATLFDLGCISSANRSHLMRFSWVYSWDLITLGWAHSSISIDHVFFSLLFLHGLRVNCP